MNLYLPFFMFYRNSSEEEPGPPLQIDGKCCACMNVYQFWYTVDDTGEISITNHDSVRHGETFLRMAGFPRRSSEDSLVAGVPGVLK